MPLAWSQSNRLGIQWGDGWHAGHLEDVLEADASTLLVASATGGVWMLRSGLGLPLSMAWDAVDTTSLARGPHGPSHFYCGATTAAGRGALYETDTTQPAPLWSPWRSVAPDPGMGSVRAIVVDPLQPAIAVATGSGLWWSPIPVRGGAYSWTLASGIAGDRAVQRLVATASGSLIAAIDGGLLVGGWDRGRLTMRPSTVNGVAADQMNFMALGASPSSAQRAYAGFCHWAGSGAFAGLLRTDDGGATWSARGAMVGGALLVEHSSYGYTGAVAVHPTRPDTVVVGYTRGPYVSNDGGDTFTPTDRNATHDDKHAYHFTPSGRLYEANDGGVVYTDDLGARLRSEFNRSLANLQFLGPSARDWWGRTTASYQHPGLIGGGLQDNSDVYCQRWPNGSTTPWRRLPEWMFDGQAIMFLRDGSALFSYGDVRVARWEAPALIAEPSPIPIRINRPGVTQPGNGLASGPYAIVNDPQWRNADGHLMFAAIVSNGRDLYGLFAADDGSDKHWNYLTTMPFAEGSLASAVSSGSGVSVLVGVRGRGEIWRVDLRSGVERTVSTGLPSTTDFSSCVLDIVIQDESPWDAYAVWYDHAGHGALYHTTDGGSWSPLGGLPDENLFCIATDWTVSPKTLFVATDSRVYVSRNEGRDWTDESIGLPARSHCSDLAFVTQPDGARFLHLSTFGWSTWVTQLV